MDVRLNMRVFFEANRTLHGKRPATVDRIEEHLHMVDRSFVPMSVAEIQHWYDTFTDDAYNAPMYLKAMMDGR